MQAAIKIYLISFFTLLVTGCAWYKGPSLMPNANASLDGSSLNESNGRGLLVHLNQLITMVQVIQGLLMGVVIMLFQVLIIVKK